MYTCANCTVLACANNEPEKMPKNCPMRNASVMEAARAGYDLPENHDFYINCSAIEGLGYCQWPRLKETVEFCKRMGYHKLGLAFCKGLRKEARLGRRCRFAVLEIRFEHFPDAFEHVLGEGRVRFGIMSVGRVVGE